jgi:hypothetical protein
MQKEIQIISLNIVFKELQGGILNKQFVHDT